MCDQFIQQRLALNAQILSLHEQASNLYQYFFSITPSFLFQQEAIFKARAVQLLHLRSSQVIDTPQFSQFEKNLAEISGPLTISNMKMAFDLVQREKESIKCEAETKENSLVSSPEASCGSLFDQPASQMTFSFSKNNELDFSSINQAKNPDNFSFGMKEELQSMCRLILKNMGRNNEDIIQKGRIIFSNNKIFLEAYDALVKKYYSSKKVKEDIVRYIIRKAFKAIKKPMIKNEKIHSKQALLMLCKKYFADQFEQGKINIENEQELSEVLLPYNEKSKNRTMNTSFVQEIFSSEEFLKDYRQFLPGFKNMLQTDNNKKLEKLFSTLLECVQKKNFSKIASLKVFPWLDVWVEETIEIAQDLQNNQKSEQGFKKVKYF